MKFCLVFSLLFVGALYEKVTVLQKKMTTFWVDLNAKIKIKLSEFLYILYF
ncbi:MAG: hypothetical protein ACD_2C00079G0014 [uncultured bacterium (gcode 4)]|uniref:Uncharacterized protein n=1 Tax=uncultured bacterium (gcode 4) TaxID=1234023 RepID=K2G6E4_9BACT|nr:MAG: hypothetical protein ACD_2C00079G0014 [uncultured bacterium (gcode 4)]